MADKAVAAKKTDVVAQEPVGSKPINTAVVITNDDNDKLIRCDEDKVLFGKRNATVAYQFGELIEATLKEGVASLPLMASSTDSRDAVMLQLLRKAYLKHVDLMEMYNANNVFSVAYRTLHFRKRIVRAFLDDTPKEEAGAKEEDTKTALEPLLPAKQDIATPEELANLEEELKSLRLRLQDARKIRAQKLQRCQALEEATNFSQQAQSTVANKSSTLSKVSTQVESMRDAQTEFQSLQTRGNTLLDKMDHLKNGRDENDMDKMPSPPVAKKTKKTLEEHYEEHRSVLGETQPADLLALRDLLKP